MKMSGPSRLCLAAAGLALLTIAPVSAQETRMPARAALDHLLLGVADLDQGIAWVERLTGVRAVVGGSHPGRGTRNALVSLGERHYLEIIGPDPAQPETPQGARLKALKEPVLIGWAAAAMDLDGIAKRARDAGQPLTGPRDGSRARPDGRMLKWRTLNPSPRFIANGVDPIPFFIEWSADSRHPSEDSPAGCALQAFEIEHPQANDVAQTLDALGIDAVVRENASARLLVTLKTPKGVVTLGSSPAAARRASGAFDVKLTPQGGDDGAPDGPALARMSIDKQFEGDLQGTSKGEMLTAAGSTHKDSAGYVAVERVTGTLHGKKGSFALQHSGIMTRGAPQLTIAVVPDSATGELTGLAGSMTIRIEGKKHYYEFRYTLPQ